MNKYLFRRLGKKKRRNGMQAIAVDGEYALEAAHEVHFF